MLTRLEGAIRISFDDLVILSKAYVARKPLISHIRKTVCTILCLTILVRFDDDLGNLCTSNRFIGSEGPIWISFYYSCFTEIERILFVDMSGDIRKRMS
jgi:hypothetical protein